MPVEVRSPINRASRRSELSTGARSMPGAGDRRRDNAEPEPSLLHHGASKEPEPSLPVNHQAQEPGKPEPLRGDEEPRERDEPVRGDAVSVQESMMNFYLRNSVGAATIKIGRPGEDY